MPWIYDEPQTYYHLVYIINTANTSLSMMYIHATTKTIKPDHAHFYYMFN
jgi:hypothetical protein